MKDLNAFYFFTIFLAFFCRSTSYSGMNEIKFYSLIFYIDFFLPTLSCDFLFFIFLLRKGNGSPRPMGHGKIETSFQHRPDRVKCMKNWVLNNPIENTSYRWPTVLIGEGEVSKNNATSYRPTSDENLIGISKINESSKGS